MTSEFRKVLDLIKRTKERLIFYDSGNDSSFVILSLGEYEKLLTGQGNFQELTREDFLAKINRDIAVWREGEKQKKIAEAEVQLAKNNSQPDQTVEEPVDEEKYYFEPVE